MWEGCTNRVAVAGTVSALLLTLAACWASSRSVSSGVISSWVVFELSRGPIELRVAPRAAPRPLPTHEPYSTQPLGHLASPRYQAICPLEGSQQRACVLGAYNASGPGPLQSCTPDSLRRWNGKGRWFRDEDGHYRCKPMRFKSDVTIH